MQWKEKKHGRMMETWEPAADNRHLQDQSVKKMLKALLDDSADWEIEKLLKRRSKSGVEECLVRWEGFAECEDSWEPTALIPSDVYSECLGQPATILERTSSVVAAVLPAVMPMPAISAVSGFAISAASLTNILATEAGSIL